MDPVPPPKYQNSPIRVAEHPLWASAPSYSKSKSSFKSPVGLITIGLLRPLYVLSRRMELFAGHGHSKKINKKAYFRNQKPSLKSLLVAHTAHTLSFVSAALTDTCDVTSAADDAVLTCCLTIMNTAHFGVPLKLFPFYFQNKYHLRASTGHSRRFLRIFNRFRPCKSGQKRSQSLQDHFKFIIESLLRKVYGRF